VLIYARTHTHTTWILDVSPGVGRTPGEPEESRSTKAQYTCRPYRCTYTHVHIHAYMHTHVYAHLYTDRKCQQRCLNASSHIIDAHTYPYTHACICIYICTYIYVHILQRVCRRCVGNIKKHVSNVYNCTCTGAKNTCPKVHATLTVRKCTYRYTYTHMHTHKYAHKRKCASMTPANTP